MFNTIHEVKNIQIKGIFSTEKHGDMLLYFKCAVEECKSKFIRQNYGT